MGLKFADEIKSALRLSLRSFSLNDMWEEQPPEDAGHQSLEEYMTKVSAHTFKNGSF